MKSVLVLVLVTVAVTPANAGWLTDDHCTSPTITSRYDPELERASRRYLPQPYAHHWCFLKAQFYVESRLNPSAVSPVGAQGIAQVMPATAREIRVKWKILGESTRASVGIEQGAAYMAQMITVWQAPRSAECRLELAWASYNAGAGNIIRAQEASGGARCWDGIGPYLHRVTGRHSAETLAYVQRIWRVWRQLIGFAL